MPTTQLSAIFPLIDPLDLDLVLSWSFGNDRKGHTYAHALRPSPAYSIVNPIHTQVQQALLSGEKAKRTMYEETGRLRRVLVDSVLDGSLSREEDPIEVRMRVSGAVKGIVRVKQQGGMASLDVQVEVRNRSPALRTRWLLRLPSERYVYPVHFLLRSKLIFSNTTEPNRNQASFLGLHVYSGSLEPNMSKLIQCKIMVAESGMVEMSGWTLEVETGDEVEGEWRPRMSWTRVGSGGIIQVDISQE